MEGRRSRERRVVGSGAWLNWHEVNWVQLASLCRCSLSSARPPLVPRRPAPPTPESMGSRNTPLRDRLFSNPPDPIKSSILRESGMGWNPAPPPDNTSSLSSTSSADTLTSPLRIAKRDTPTSRPRGPIIPRRTSNSYRHMSTNNLVSKSPFKSQIPPPATPSTRPAPIAISFPTGSGRRVSGEKRQRPKSLHEEGEQDNDRPFALKRERKQSKAFEVLLEKEPVSKSPFKHMKSASETTTTSSLPVPIPIPKRRPASESHLESPAQQASSVSPRPSPGLSAPIQSGESGSPRPSPGRSVLVSRRMHGPRLSGSGKRERRKTVTFDERCDVVEFDRDEESDEDVFASDSDEDQEPQQQDEDGSDNSMQYDDEDTHKQIQIPMLPLDDSNADNIDQDDDSYDSQPLDGDDKKNDPLTPFDVDASLTGIVNDLFFGKDAGSLADNSLASVTSTPPRQSSLPPELETEGGVPLGRSHHVERFLQHHSPHLQGPRISPSRSPQSTSPGRYPFNLNLPTHASPNGPPATPPRRSPGMSHSTPPLGRTSLAERLKDARDQENAEVANVLSSPSTDKSSAFHETAANRFSPGYDLSKGSFSSLPRHAPSHHCSQVALHSRKPWQRPETIGSFHPNHWMRPPLLIWKITIQEIGQTLPVPQALTSPI